MTLLSLIALLASLVLGLYRRIIKLISNAFFEDYRTPKWFENLTVSGAIVLAVLALGCGLWDVYTAFKPETVWGYIFYGIFPCFSFIAVGVVTCALSEDFDESIREDCMFLDLDWDDRKIFNILWIIVWIAVSILVAIRGEFYPFFATLGVLALVARACAIMLWFVGYPVLTILGYILIAICRLGMWLIEIFRKKFWKK